MSFEKQHQSFASQPITPTHTPPPGDFHDADGPSTPKIESTFYDPRVTWDTANPTASPDLQKTPRPFAPSTPVSKSSTSLDPAGLDAQAAKLLITPNFALLSPQLRNFEDSRAKNTLSSMESSIRTPPPTNTANAKRKEKQNGSNRTHKRSESSNRQLLPKPLEAGPSVAPEDAPLHFTPLAFNTPDFFNQETDGAVTAPTYPQQKLFWDNDPNAMELDFSTDNPFATPKPQGLEPFISAHGPPVPLPQGTFLDFDGVLGNPDYNTNTANTALDSQLSNFGLGVDPSLLFTSSNTAAASSQLPAENDSLQPYAYQMQEARREQAYAGITKAKRRRKPSVDSPAVVAALETLRDKGRPQIRRSVTDTHVARSGRSSSSSSRAGTSHGGRSSPLKQFRSETKRQHRQSVGLVIGSDGRARLQPVLHQERTLSSRDGKDMEVDSAAYSSESESTESEDDDTDNQNAMVTSFSADTTSGMGMPKLGRFSSTATHSQKSSFSSLYSSNSEPSKVRKPSSKRASRHILDPVKEGGSFEDDRRQEADNAQAALMSSMKASQRGRYSPQKQSSGLEPFVSSPSTSMAPGSGFGGPVNPSAAFYGRRSSFR